MVIKEKRTGSGKLLVRPFFFHFSKDSLLKLIVSFALHKASSALSLFSAGDTDVSVCIPVAADILEEEIVAN